MDDEFCGVKRASDAENYCHLTILPITRLMTKYEKKYHYYTVIELLHFPIFNNCKFNTRAIFQLRLSDAP